VQSSARHRGIHGIGGNVESATYRIQRVVWGCPSFSRRTRFFLQTIDDIALLLVDPTGERNEQTAADAT
jgi:hypothetical protein